MQRELQSSLLLEAAERITSGEAATLPELAAANPMTLLLKPPANYVGELAAPAEADIPRASWYFDEQAGTLAYRVGRHTRFTAKEGPADRIELRVAFVFEDRDADGTFDAAGDRFGGLRLDARARLRVAGLSARLRRNGEPESVVTVAGRRHVAPITAVSAPHYVEFPISAISCATFTEERCSEQKDSERFYAD